MLEVKTVEKPDERRDFPRGHLEALHHLTGPDFAAATSEPGRRWSESVGPIAKTDSCRTHHNGYVVRGRLRLRLRLRMDDGREAEAGPGDVFACPPGHDALGRRRRGGRGARLRRRHGGGVRQGPEVTVTGGVP